MGRVKKFQKKLTLFLTTRRTTHQVNVNQIFPRENQRRCFDSVNRDRYIPVGGGVKRIFCGRECRHVIFRRAHTVQALQDHGHLTTNKEFAILIIIMAGMAVV